MSRFEDDMKGMARIDNPGSLILCVSKFRLVHYKYKRQLHPR